jgi:5-methylcytosine-specific restriction endonuclease McrA
MGLKTCSKCKAAKDEDSFHFAPGSKTLRRKQCKACINADNLARAARFAAENSSKPPVDLETTYKVCSKCKHSQTLSCFQEDSSRKDGFYPVCKACRSPLTKAQYAANQPVVRAKAKARYAENPERYQAEAQASRERFQIRAQENPALLEVKRHYHQTYYQEHKQQWPRYLANQDPAEIRRRSAAYRDANREKVREGVRDWFRRHPHAAAQAATKRRAQLAEVENTLTDEQILEILEVFNYRCGYCLVDLRTLPSHARTLDHMIPIRHGGGHTQENVIPCCRVCNARKRDRPITFMLKYVNQEGSQPAR